MPDVPYIFFKRTIFLKLRRPNDGTNTSVSDISPPPQIYKRSSTGLLSPLSTPPYLMCTWILKPWFRKLLYDPNSIGV